MKFHQKLSKTKTKTEAVRTPVEFKLAFLFLGLGMFSLALLWMVGAAEAAVPKTQSWVDARFNMPEPVHVWVGLERGSMLGRIYAVPTKAIGQVSGRGELAATCSITRIHWRWNGSKVPRFAELSCKSLKLPLLKMPLHLEWIEKSGVKGSRIYEVRARKPELIEGLFASHS